MYVIYIYITIATLHTYNHTTILTKSHDPLIIKYIPECIPGCCLGYICNGVSLMFRKPGIWC